MNVNKEEGKVGRGLDRCKLGGVFPRGRNGGYTTLDPATLDCTARDDARCRWLNHSLLQCKAEETILPKEV